MNLKILLSFAVVYLVWGSTFSAIKWGLESFPPIMLSGLRFCLAGLLFLIMSKGQGILRLRPKEYLREFFIGLCLTLGNAGVCWSEQYLSSGVVALMVGAVPLIFVLLNWLSFEKQVPAHTAMAGLMMGMVGILLIAGDDLSAANILVLVVLMLANLSWVLGSLFIRASKSPLTYFSRASIQMLSAGGLLVLSSSLFEERKVAWLELSSTGVLSVFYLALAGTVLAYTCYSYLLKNTKPEITSTYALINPLVAVMFGVIFFNEQLTYRIALAMFFICFSVLLVIFGEKLKYVKLKELVMTLLK